MRTSFTINDKTLEIIRILNIPPQKIMDRGLVALGLEGKVRDPEVAMALIRIVRDRMESLDFEIRRLKELQDKFDRIGQKEEDPVQETEEEPEIKGFTRRAPEDYVGYEPGCLPEQLAERILSDRNTALRQLHAIISAYLMDVIGNYNNGATSVIQDLDSMEFSGQGEAMWATLKQRDDLDDLISEVLADIRGD